MPPRPEGLTTEHITRGLYKFADAPSGTAHRSTVLFSGSAHSAAREAADVLAAEFGVGVELWSATSYKALREEALACERIARLNPDHPPATPLVTRLLAESSGPIVAASDFMRIVPEQIARFLPGRTFVPLGTDGLGRSDTREALRRHFEVDTAHIVLTVLHALFQEGKIDADTVKRAIDKYQLSPNTPAPFFD